VIQVWFQNRRSKEKRDASYREAGREEASVVPTPVDAPPTTTSPAHPSMTSSNIPAAAVSLSASPVTQPVAPSANGHENT